METRKLTNKELIKYKLQIAKSRARADEYVFGYKKKEMIRGDEIITLAKGSDGAGWIRVASESIM